jgi:hypothetical protein
LEELMADNSMTTPQVNGIRLGSNDLVPSDQVAALAAVSEGFCPKCAVPLILDWAHWCPSCETLWDVTPRSARLPS